MHYQHPSTVNINQMHQCFPEIKNICRFYINISKDSVECLIFVTVDLFILVVHHISRNTTVQDLNNEIVSILDCENATLTGRCFKASVLGKYDIDCTVKDTTKCQEFGSLRTEKRCSTFSWFQYIIFSPTPSHVHN